MDADDQQQQQQQRDSGEGTAGAGGSDEASDVDGAAAGVDDTGEGDVDGDQPQPPAGSESVLVVQAVSNLDSLYGLREIGREALCWQLSSAKPGNGVEQIRDANTDTCTYSTVWYRQLIDLFVEKSVKHYNSLILRSFDVLTLYFFPIDWQSDGISQPHLIQVHFARRVAISHACIYLDYVRAFPT
jgi:Anaphase-promoting complex, subunit 10 (APC10)